MTPHDLSAENERLRDENMELRRALKRALVCDLGFQRFDLTWLQQRIMAVLMAQPIATREKIMLGIYGLEAYSRDPKILDVSIHKMRKALAPHSIEIVTVPREGYRLAPEMKERVRALVAA